MRSKLRTYHNQNIGTSDLSNAAVQGMFQSRRFEVRSDSTTESQQQPDLKTSLMQAKRYGHQLSKTNFANQADSTALQPLPDTHPVQLGRITNKRRLKYQGNSTAASRKRIKGDSQFLRDVLYNKSPNKPYKPKEFSQGREAQHIIPASEGIKFGLPDSFLNSTANGMMIPAGARKNVKPLHPNYVKKKKLKSSNTQKLNEAKHIKPGAGLAHPEYNKYIGEQLKNLQGPLPENGDKVSLVTKLVSDLRESHKGGTAQYVDDITL